MPHQVIGRRSRPALAVGTVVGLALASGCSVDAPIVRVAVVDSGIAVDLDVFDGYSVTSSSPIASGDHGTMMASVTQPRGA